MKDDARERFLLIQKIQLSLELHEVTEQLSAPEPTTCVPSTHETELIIDTLSGIITRSLGPLATWKVKRIITVASKGTQTELVEE